MSAHPHRIAVACLIGSAALLLALAASAQQPAVPGTGWRRPRRAGDMDQSRYASAQNFAFEVRFGPYYPDVDAQFGGSGPYKKVFGDDARLYFGVEFDWLPLRIPYIGATGPGVGWGYTSASDKAKITGTDKDSDEETSLTIMPMHLSGVVRFDELMRRTGIPIVPYAKFGLGLGLWSTSAGSETSRVKNVAGKNVVGRDTTWGTHLALGGMFALNFLDRRSAAQLDESTGINHAYLFGEWMYANLSGIGSRPQMDIGASTWVAGLAFDM
jgi:hypothetical protein